MAQVARIRGEWPEVVLRIETSGNLDLGNVARLFERVNTGVRAAFPGSAPRIEIVSLENGSILLRIAILSAVLTAGQLALQISDHLQTNPAANRACGELFKDNATQIKITGGKQNITVTNDDVDEDYQAVAAREAAGERATSPRPIVSIAEGSFEGTVERISGTYYIQLTDRPGLFLRIEDQRSTPDLWQEHHQYSVRGRALFAPVGKPSAFIVEEAFLL